MSAYKDRTDEELALLLTEGDQKAYTEIYHRYKAPVYAHIFNRLRDREEARDLAQDLFSNIWLKHEDFKLRSSLKAYLFSAARYKVFDWISRSQVESNYLTEIGSFIDSGECVTDHRVRETQLLALIDKEIENLPPRMREIFELSRKGGFSHREIAEKLDLSEQTVKKQVNNSLKILRTKFGPAIFIAFFL